jgi:hypothetical protein
VGGEMETKLTMLSMVAKPAKVHYFGRTFKEGTKEYELFMNGDL